MEDAKAGSALQIVLDPEEAMLVDFDVVRFLGVTEQGFSFEIAHPWEGVDRKGV